MSKALAIPTARELEALSPSDRWDIEDAIGEAQTTLRAFNDEELRRWVEVEGRTQTEIAGMVGRPQSTISHRCIRLGISPTTNRGRPRITNVGNSALAALAFTCHCGEQFSQEVIHCDGCGHHWPTVGDRDRCHNCYREYPASEPEVVTGEIVETDKMAVHYSSATDEWATPQAFFDRLDDEFGFDLDVCALDSSAKCARYFTPETDGLAQDWTGTCWMNPPYGSEIVEWVAKAHESAEENGATVVCLVPARVDTGWWWDHCRYGEIRFLRGRLKFGDSETSAPFPSALVIFGRPANVLWWEG